MTGGRARLTFLGTGTSQGVPIIGCKCEVCRSKDERDKRFRASVFVEYEGLNILVDAGPDFRIQMLRLGISHLDAILLTHNHKDHTGGLDDVRSLNYVDRRAAEIYCERNVLEDLIREYPYVFKFPKYPGAPEWMLHVIDERPFILRKDTAEKELVWVHDIGYHYRLPNGQLIPTARCLDDMIDEAPKAVAASSDGSTASLRSAPPLASLRSAPVPPLTVPRVAWVEPARLAATTPSGDSERSDAGSLRGTPLSPPRGRRGGDSVPVSGGTIVTPIRGLHDKLPVLGFRFGDIAYITDMSTLPESEFAKLQGLKHLTLNTVGYNKHHSHFSLQETLDLADRIQAEHTWLTHLSHSFPVHEVFDKELERMCSEQHIHSIVRPAYDGLVIE
ncbi:MAG: MBL fold metallo-hydrolase [Bacteroidales bacterium]|nr:MBL fold metallo-hydrolase [Bacteroidales bacterium]